MKHYSAGLFASVFACAAFTNAPLADAAREKVLYSFDGYTGWDPNGLIDVGGTFYGTTEQAGNYSRGTVFSFDPTTDVETVIYSFQDSNYDGQYPEGALIDVNDKLYGTTSGGGEYNDGTVFSIDPGTGTEKILYAFRGGADGEYPSSSLLNVKGTLYGTTEVGGAYGGGTVFAFDLKTGAETVIHSFGSGTDGSIPGGNPIDEKGVLFGTTVEGGAYDNCGTVFGIDLTTGTEAVVHSFDGTDGFSPPSGLVDFKSNLYGITQFGDSYDSGTVFAVSPETGTETFLYSFGASDTDGQQPLAGLVEKNGVLYGTTNGGGAQNDGTVFAVDPNTGTETVLHAFGGTDGQYPQAYMIELGSWLYGTTGRGGAYGAGTIFKIKRP